MEFNVGVGVVDSHKVLEGFTGHTQNGLGSVLEHVQAAQLTVLAELEIRAFCSGEPLSWDQRYEGEERELRVGEKWGGLFDCAWMHFTGVIPADAPPSSSPVLLLDVNGEMCIYDEEGRAQHGLTSLTSEFDLSLGKPGKRVLRLPPGTAAGTSVDVWADCGCNDLFGNLQENGVVRQACVAMLDEEIQALYFDMEVLCDFLKVLPEASPRARQILHAVSSAAKAVQPICDTTSARKARSLLAPQLAKQGGDPDLSISACGHAHMDLAWLWPIRETMRKAARTFATVLANMERYPDYVFGASQPQQLLWIKEQHPEMFAQIQQRVREGRWECQGAMWVEPDTNVTGGESLIRQILLGQAFWREEFDIEVKNMWEPDVFGYSAALPQILKRSGVDYMMTQKLSWNTVNFFPHHSFKWQGIDSTIALVHTLPEETYNSPALPRAVHKVATNYREAGVSDHALMLFGIGDGGGGPGTEHLERLQRLKNMAGLSPVRQESATQFFEKWETQSNDFPTWVGELYLEKHQGTFTTNAATKKGNRAMEIALRELELISVQLMLATSSTCSADSDDCYPHDELQLLWREVLLYQFHDILPGSSIKRVYDECEERYGQMLQAVGLMTAQRRQRLLEIHVGVSDQAVVAAEGASASSTSGPVLWNTLSWERNEWIQHGQIWLHATVPGLGAASTSVDTPLLAKAQGALLASDEMIENDLLRVKFDLSSGSLCSIFDKQHGREVLSGDASLGNRLAVYLDDGDAWDFPMDCELPVQLYDADQTPRYMTLVGSKVAVDGPTVSMTQHYALGEHTTLTQKVVLVAGSRRLDFRTQAHWREPQAMLRTSFPVAVQSETATFEIQMGTIHRPTHTNTTWDLAKSEVPAQKWADLSQRDYGVALLNDCKYGYKVKGNVLDLNLLRSVVYPRQPLETPDSEREPGAPRYGFTDQCEHCFTYSLLPHAGDHVEGNVVREAYQLNMPLANMSSDAPTSGTVPGLCEIDAPAVIVETVKAAEDGSGDVIMRLYESFGGALETAVRFNTALVGASLVDMMERPLSAQQKVFERKAGLVELNFGPYEIKTLRLQFDSGSRPKL